MREFYIITFNNTHEAMEAESHCVNKKIKVTMMPTPTYITKSCGISLKVELGAIESIKTIINQDNLRFKNVYELKENMLREVTL